MIEKKNIVQPRKGFFQEANIMAHLIWLDESPFLFAFGSLHREKKCFYRSSSPHNCHFDIGWFGISCGDREARTYCLTNYFSLWPCFYCVILWQYQSYLASMCFDSLWDWMHLLQLYFIPRCLAFLWVFSADFSVVTLCDMWVNFWWLPFI